MSGETLILAVLTIPLITAFAIFLLDTVPDLREGATLLGAGALFVTTILLVSGMEVGEGLSLTVASAAPGLDFSFKLEPLGALFALVASGLWIVNSFYSIGYMRGNRERNQTRFYICFAIALFGAMGVALAGNLFTLFIFYEVLTISTYPLVAHKGDANAQRGARIYLMTLLGTSIGLFLVAIVGTSTIAGSLDFVPGGLLAGKVSPVVGNLLLLLFAFGIGKAALMPFHFWLPNAMVAPTPVSALLHAVAVVKAGVFAMLKIAIYVFGIDLLNDLPATDWVLAVACFTILASSLIALTKDNLKARLAYSTIGQLAYVTAGAMLATEAGFLGGSLQIAAHAMGKITLFMCAGAIYVATGLTEISDMRGLGRRMPWVFGAFFVASLSIIGIPPLAGGWPKFQLLLGAVEAKHAYVAWVLLISSLLNIAYLLPIPILGLLPPKGTPEPAPYKRPEGAPRLVVIAPVVTATGTFVLFFAMGAIAHFLSPILGGA
ncbi:MAG: proton-conducting transporter membrane subunit [Pseudomonadota bacterium]